LVERATGERVAGPPRTGSAGAQVDIWSTDATRTRERFSYWRDAVCQAVFNISIDAAPQRFAARIPARSCGPLRFATSECTDYQIIQSRLEIESAPADHYSVYMQLHGQTACGAALRDQHQRELNISEIAYRWGFNDLSHFNKAFHAQFNQTPRDWRNGADR
jgi:hypothetical protein